MRRLLIAVMALGLLACGDSTAPLGPISGTFELTTVNDVALPFTVSNPGDIVTQEVTSDVITARNGTFTRVVDLRATNTQTGQVTTQTLSDAGTYAVNGTRVNFSSSQGLGMGTFTDNAITIVDSGFTLVYLRRS
jgi:hypothetical protein